MKLKLTICIILISTGGFAQNKAVVKFSPLSVIDDASFPTIQAGIEFNIHKRISWYNELGIKYRKGYYEKTDTISLASKGFKAKTEFRYYWQNKNGADLAKNPEGNYFAINCFYNRDFHNTEIEYYYLRDTSMNKFDDLGVKKKVWGLNLLVGTQKPISRKVLLDFYTGLGIRFRNVSAINKEFDSERDYLHVPIDVNINGIRDKIDSKAGNTVAPTFTLGVRFCYKL